MQIGLSNQCYDATQCTRSRSSRSLFAQVNEAPAKFIDDDDEKAVRVCERSKTQKDLSLKLKLSQQIPSQPNVRFASYQLAGGGDLPPSCISA